MIYAQIKDSFVKNVITLDDTDLLSLFEVGYDYLIDITVIDPQPGIGWGYDGNDFIAPTPEIPIPSGAQRYAIRLVTDADSPVAISSVTDRTLIVDNSAGSVILNLPTGDDGLEYFIDTINTATVNTVNIVTNGTDTIQTGITVAGNRLFAGATANNLHIQFLDGNWSVLSYVEA